MIALQFLKRVRTFDNGVVNQLAGITGLGWTMSMLGFLSTVVGYGSGPVARLVADPHSLLYLGAIFFVATLGLDQLVDQPDEPEES